jgi:hypothetical protein
MKARRRKKTNENDQKAIIRSFLYSFRFKNKKEKEI